MKPLPDFAKPIADARARGFRPAGMVIVSDGDHGLHRRYPQNPVVRVRPEQRPSTLSWRFLAGLDVEIATEDDGNRAVALAMAVDGAQPDYLRVWHLPSGRMMRLRFCGVRMVCRESEALCM